MQLKKLAAAMALVAAAPAFASIQGTSLGNGELFLVVFDATAQVSFTKDLGINIDDFNSNAGISQSLSSGSGHWESFLGLANASNLQFAVLGGDNAGPRRLFTTIDRNNTPINATQLNGAIAQTSAYSNYQVTTSDNTTHAGPASINGDSWDGVGNSAYFLNMNMRTFVNQAQGGWTNSNAVGTQAVFRQFANNLPGGGSPATATDFAGVWTIDQVGDSWAVNYAVAAVPEGDGLALALAGLGVIGVVSSRRRRSQG